MKRLSCLTPGMLAYGILSCAAFCLIALSSGCPVMPNGVGHDVVRFRCGDVPIRRM